MTINWGAMVDDAMYDAHELERREKIRNALAAREREQQRERAQERAQNAPPLLPHPAAKTQGLPSASAYRAPVDVLAAAMVAAPDDAARTKLLAAASRELREQFRAMLVYRAMAEADAVDPYEEFTRRLDAAASDEERRAIIGATDPAFRREWKWRRTATADDWARRFLVRANGGQQQASDY